MNGTISSIGMKDELILTIVPIMGRDYCENVGDNTAIRVLKNPVAV
jgi:hypothetical protein